MSDGALVTGAANFLGHHLIKQLNARGERPRAFVDADARPSPGLRSLDNLDIERHEVRCGDQAIQLTVNEFAVLHCLMRRPGRVATRAVLVNEVYELDHHITERTIDTYVRRIRRKFEASGVDPIETVFGVGYRFEVQPRMNLRLDVGFAKELDGWQPAIYFNFNEAF